MKKKNRAIIPIVIVVVAIAAAGLYLLAANSYSLWPFTPNTHTPAADESPANTTPASIIKSTKVQNKDGVKILTIGVQLEKREKGTCTLTLKNQSLSLTMKGNIKDSKDQLGCSGWSADVTKLPKGEYAAKVTFKGATHQESGSSTFTLK